MEKPDFTISEFAKILGVSQMTVRRGIKDRHIRAYRVARQCIRIPREELERIRSGEAA
ncbi:excisionase family DNA-binding protein [Limibaculum sp. FT325]|uniref:excisionase family DNA-binding protein n=1 Tax=Thermohalobaculum sediminis TaxID=2939436 RepID=UPI0020C02010|nr:excisionase family DNA-binding protein [Limibaculum sediminis]MCL5778129.1 excisionase family DNA-binding protein [Limibaculum sediminis]